MDEILSTNLASQNDSPPTDQKVTPPSRQAHPDSPPITPAEKQALVFAKAALAFHDSLEKHRNHGIVQPASPPSTPKASEASIPKVEIHNGKHARQIRLLRTIQHTMTSLLSLTIAILQGRTYAIYTQTKSVPNAWPTHPSLMPTLMLFGIAVAALTFDCCALVAYIFPHTNIARKAYTVALKSHNIITSAKTVSWALVAIICRSGFNQGNTSGTNSDLWSWSCSAKGAELKDVNMAAFNCTADTIAWVLTLFQILIEILGVIINVLVGQKNNNGSSEDKQKDNGDNSPDPEKKALISDDQLEQWGDDLNTELEAATPDLKGDSGESKAG